jgi:hypothetical protein
LKLVGAACRANSIMAWPSIVGATAWVSRQQVAAQGLLQALYVLADGGLSQALGGEREALGLRHRDEGPQPVGVQHVSELGLSQLTITDIRFDCNSK